MLQIAVPAPTINRRPKSKGKPKRGPNGKLVPAKPRPAFLNANQRLDPHGKAKITALWREAGRDAAEAAQLTAQNTKWFALALVHLPRKATYDAGNYYPSVKAIIDGVVTDYDLLPDDSNEYLIGPLTVRGGTAADGVGGISLWLFDLHDDEDRELLQAWLRAL